MGEFVLKLGGKVVSIQQEKIDSTDNRLLSISTNIELPNILRSQKAFFVNSGVTPPSGFSHYIVLESNDDIAKKINTDSPITVVSDDFNYIGDKDVIRISPDTSQIRVLYRNTSNQNSILITEQCNHYCLMCSQPPKKHNDSWLLDEASELVNLIPREAKEIGITGGEPTLGGKKFISLLQKFKNLLPDTTLHILSNGRKFSESEFSVDYAKIAHPDMMVGIPLYSSSPSIHDYIVQSKGAFDETIRGILNLKKLNQKVEIRVVIHKQSIGSLIELCNFISRNLLFVDHVALMGLEMTGFTRANIDKLWIDPYDYKDTLSIAVDILSKFGINTSIYNHPLCLINPEDESNYRKSISDWKNEFADECLMCERKSDCGGFFSSGIMHGYSTKLRPF